MSHDSPIYGGCVDLMAHFNIKWSMLAENVAAGQNFPELVVYAWMNSPPHRKNILTPQLTHLSVGYEPNGHYWTQHFRVPAAAPIVINVANVADWEQKVAELTSQERTKHGLAPLKWDDKLGKMARFKSEDMAQLKVISHDSPTYGGLLELFAKFRVLYKMCAENVAQGQTSPEQVVESWMNSPGHRKNILTPQFTHIGVGLDPNGFYWTQEFMQK